MFWFTAIRTHIFEESLKRFCGTYLRFCDSDVHLLQMQISSSLYSVPGIICRIIVTLTTADKQL